MGSGLRLTACPSLNRYCYKVGNLGAFRKGTEGGLDVS